MTTTNRWPLSLSDDAARVHAEYRSCLAIRHTRGIGPRTWKGLLDHYGSACAAVEHVQAWKDEGLATLAQMQAFERETWKNEAACEETQVCQAGMSYVLYTQGAYPERLREIPDPPILLYTLGDIAVLGRPCLAVVGSRQCTSYARRMAARLCSDIARAGLTLVSGFAQGVDRIAHETGCREHGSTIAVLGTGLDIVYPASNRDIWEPVASSGLIVSEFPPKTLPEAKHFPYRNRIISGLSLGVLVVQAAAKSGSLITARCAMEQNREVFAVPGPVGSGYEGCHELIQSGAKLVQEYDDILEELAPLLQGIGQDPRPAPSREEPWESAWPDASLDEQQRQVVCCLKKHGKLHIDALTQLLGWESNKVSQTLVMLEVLGRLEQHPGKLYSLLP
ncbi:DNA-processing protein DprA [Desulfoplanes formicivorans]|uniref:DNA protecting protein DprA n=1 Tax=Desulfoplanes formicivorans TaxID=1592317 RepID=A0A194AK96_9BACT|nr:DNA-processing protein DprA [Desulfoplanes formicivorans]GAU09738.1 DNA protecting protein DprA [Desulfoplanes formicivorans]